jgi:nitrate reductase NapA
MAADRSILFKPQTDLAIANAICHEIIRTDAVHEGFVRDHVSVPRGQDQHRLRARGQVHLQGRAEDDRPRALLASCSADYSVEKVEALSGVPARELRYLASHLRPTPKKKVMSLWCMGFNQHTRGTWINNLVYNIHLLVGKIATPGNSPFSLTGQPSACGTVREVGTLTQRLPHGDVTEEKARKLARRSGACRSSASRPSPRITPWRCSAPWIAGDIRFLWIQVTNPMVTMPKLRRLPRRAQEGRPLHRGLRRLPHAHHRTWRM